MSAEALAALAVALGAGWASGLNSYAAVLVLGGAERQGLVHLPHDLQVLGSPWVLGVAAILFALNFFADKIPYVDSINDMQHTFVRIPAGALLAYGAAAGISPDVAVIAGLLGGTLAATAATAASTSTCAPWAAAAMATASACPTMAAPRSKATGSYEANICVTWRTAFMRVSSSNGLARCAAKPAWRLRATSSS